MKAVVLILTYLVFFAGCRESEKPISIRNNEALVIQKVVIPSSELEKATINGAEPNYFSIAEAQSGYYILSIKEQILAKFSRKGKALYKYSQKGQGPGEFMRPMKVFLTEKGDPSVFDIAKRSIFLFDRNLNFIKEVKVTPSIRNIEYVNNRIYAFGSFAENCFAEMSSDYHIAGTFRKKPVKAPFDNVYQIFLYYGSFLEKEIAYTSWGYYEKVCSVEIFDGSSESTKAELMWDNPHIPTREDIANFRNMYFCNRIGETEDYYIVQTRYTPVLKKGTYRNLRVFSKAGRQVALIPVESDLINSTKGRLYSFDNQSNIVKLIIKKRRRSNEKP